MQRIGFGDLDSDAVRYQQEDLRAMQQRKDEQPLVDHFPGINIQDNTMAKEDEVGNIVRVENEKAAVMAKAARMDNDGPPAYSALAAAAPSGVHGGDAEDEEEEEQHTISMENNDDPLFAVDPVPEPDYGPDRETVRFGSEGHGFDIKWDHQG